MFYEEASGVPEAKRKKINCLEMICETDHLGRANQLSRIGNHKAACVQYSLALDGDTDGTRKDRPLLLRNRSYCYTQSGVCPAARHCRARAISHTLTHTHTLITSRLHAHLPVQPR